MPTAQSAPAISTASRNTFFFSMPYSSARSGLSETAMMNWPLAGEAQESEERRAAPDRRQHRRDIPVADRDIPDDASPAKASWERCVSGHVPKMNISTYATNSETMKVKMNTKSVEASSPAGPRSRRFRGARRRSAPPRAISGERRQERESSELDGYKAGRTRCSWLRPGRS